MNGGKLFLTESRKLSEMATANPKRKFPCPVCTDPREVRVTKKDKPYITCDPCGIQVFVRGPAGIEGFNRLVDETSSDVWSRITEMGRRYRLRCPGCGHRFWIKPDRIVTSIFDGSLKGVRCPGKDCGETVRWENEQ